MKETQFRGSVTYRIFDGTLIVTDQGVQLFRDDGLLILFEGVSLSLRWVWPGTAYQLNGCIHISQKWLNHNFTCKDFIHEYGHYLQQSTMNRYQYLLKIGLPSVFSVLYDRLFKVRRHHSRWFEKEATQLGRAYYFNQMEKDLRSFRT